MNWNRGHSPPWKGGVAATPRSGRGGCVSDKNHPGCASQGTGPFLGGAQPPLLGKEGNALNSNSFTPSMTASGRLLRLRSLHREIQVLRYASTVLAKRVRKKPYSSLGFRQVVVVQVDV